MRTSVTTISILAAMVMAACSADVGDAGGSLTLVDANIMTSQTLYMAADVSEVPLSELQLIELGIDNQDAIPVRVEIFETVAVAWYAPDGEARIGQDFIVALWEVQGRQEIAGETREDGSAPVVASNGVVSADPNAAAAAQEGVELELAPLISDGEGRLVDFYDRVGTPEMWQLMIELGNYHPGCL